MRKLVGLKNKYTKEYLFAFRIEDTGDAAKDLAEVFIEAVELGISLNAMELRGLDLRGQDLSELSLMDADFSEVDLSETKLGNNYLWDTIGDGTYIKNIEDLPVGLITYTNEVLQIDSEQHPIEEWRSFKGNEIGSMDGDVWAWWRKNKELIFKTIDENPALSTRYKEKADG